MRILILVDCYLPSTKSSAKLVHDLAAEIVAQGHRATVVAPDDTLDRSCRIDDEAGVTVVRVRSARIKGASKVARAIHEWRLSSVLWRGAGEFFRSEPHDLVAFYSPTIFFGALVRRLKRLWGCPSYLILRDIFPQWAVDAGVLRKGGLIWRFFRRKEIEQYDAADVIGVQSPANREYFDRQGLSRRYRLEVLYNWTALDEPEVPQTGYRRSLGLEGKVVFFYGGNIGVAQDMDNVLRLASGLREERDLHFLLVGEGSEVPRLRRQVAGDGLSNVSIRPAVAQREYLGMLREFDVGLISLDRGLKTQNFPGKLLGYLYFGLPVLASINPGNDLRSVLEESEAGLVSLNGDDGELRRNALRLAQDAELRQRIGRSGRRLLEQRFSAARATGQLLAQIHRPGGAETG